MSTTNSQLATKNCPKEANFPPQNEQQMLVCAVSWRFLIYLTVGHSADQLSLDHASTYTSEADVSYITCVLSINTDAIPTRELLCNYAEWKIVLAKVSLITQASQKVRITECFPTNSASH